jgi:uncharacterized protein (TIGR02246 family)
MRRATLAAATLAVATMLGQAHAWAESARDGIEAADRAFEAAFAKGDAASVAQLYTADGALLPPGAARVDGRAGIERYWKDAIDAGFKSIALQVEEVTDAGDLAVEVGRWTIGAPGGTAQMAAGKYLVEWRRVDGTWRIHRDMWNDDPAAAK